MNSGLSQPVRPCSLVVLKRPLVPEYGLKRPKQPWPRGSQFVAMRNGKHSEKLVGTTRQAKIHFAGVALTRRAANPTFQFQTIDELNRRVVTDLQALGQRAHRGLEPRSTSLDGK